jgi:hypothetical protein
MASSAATRVTEYRLCRRTLPVPAAGHTARREEFERITPPEIAVVVPSVTRPKGREIPGFLRRGGTGLRTEI